MLDVRGEMSSWQLWLQHPERVWVRKCFFYIHLWVGGWSRPVYRSNEPYGQLDCLPQRAWRGLPSLVSSVEWIVDLHENLAYSEAMAVSVEAWNRRDFRDFVVFDWSRYLVARNQQLASCFDRELEIAFCAVQLGPA